MIWADIVVIAFTITFRVCQIFIFFFLLFVIPAQFKLPREHSTRWEAFNSSILGIMIWTDTVVIIHL